VVGSGECLDMRRSLRAFDAVYNCVFRTNVTGRFGIVTDVFGNVTGHFGNVTERTGRQDWRCA
jgi:hypothetical protein